MAHTRRQTRREPIPGRKLLLRFLHFRHPWRSWLAAGMDARSEPPGMGLRRVWRLVGPAVQAGIERAQRLNLASAGGNSQHCLVFEQIPQQCRDQGTDLQYLIT